MRYSRLAAVGQGRIIEMIDAHPAETLVFAEPRGKPQLVRLDGTILDDLAAGHVSRPHARVEGNGQEGQRNRRKRVVHQAEYGWVQQQTLFGCSATRHSGGSGDSMRART